MTPKEFDIKGTVTLGFIVWIAMISFSMGILYAKITDHTEQIIKAREYTTQEVDGLRADWERDRKEQECRMELLEKKHSN